MLLKFVTYLKNIKNDSTIQINLLILASTHLRRRKSCRTHTTERICNTADLQNLRTDLEMLGAVNQISDVEILNVVTGYDVRINFAHKLSPFSQHCLLIFACNKIGASGHGTSALSEDDFGKRLRTVLFFANASNLNNRIFVWGWKNTRIGSAFNVKTKNPQRRNISVWFFSRLMHNQFVKLRKNLKS